MNKKQLLFNVALAMASIVTTLCIYTSALIYFSQREYFSNYFLELMSIPLIYLSSIGVFLWFICAFLPHNILKFISAVLIVTALLVWLQSDLFSISYGALDGSMINFEEYAKRGKWELLVILSSLIMAFVFNQQVNKHASLVIGIVLLGQLAHASYHVIQEPTDKPVINALDKEFFNYSPKKNIIVIILDTFGGDVFEGVLSAHPEFLNEFDGFVSYNDAISNYPATKASLPSMLTGQMIPQDYELIKFIDEVVSKKGLPAFFDNQGFQVSVISVATWFRNFYAKRYMSEPPFLPEELKRYNAALLFDYSLFRSAPHIIKEHIYGQGNWLLSERISTHTKIPNSEPEQAHLFLDLMSENAVIADETPRFKIIHVSTPHPKFVFDQNCQKDSLEPNKPTRHYLEQQSTCALRMLIQLLDKYKKMGIYDDSVIVVSSDHGDRNFDDKSLTGFPSYFEMNSSGIMFMIKGIGQTGKFKQVTQPFSLLKLFNALSDRSLHSTKYDSLIDLDRQFYAFRNTFIGSEGMIQDAPLYHVAAEYKNPASWQFKKYVINQCEALDFPIEITLKATDRSQYCGIFGFVPDYVSGHVWTESVDNRIVFKLKESEVANNKSHTIRFKFGAEFIKHQSDMLMSVLLNRKKIGEIMISKPALQEHAIKFSGELFNNGGIQELQLLMPDLKSEFQLGISESTRVLGVMMESIRISID